MRSKKDLDYDYKLIRSFYRPASEENLNMENTMLLLIKMLSKMTLLGCVLCVAKTYPGWKQMMNREPSWKWMLLKERFSDCPFSVLQMHHPSELSWNPELVSVTPRQSELLSLCHPQVTAAESQFSCNSLSLSCYSFTPGPNNVYYFML